MGKIRAKTPQPDTSVGRRRGKSRGSVASLPPDPSRPLAMERHERFAQHLADPLLTVEEAGAKAGYKTRSMYAIKGLYGIDARAAWLRAERQREIEKQLLVAAQYNEGELLELSVEQGRSVVARIALNTSHSGRTRLAAVALYEQLYRKGAGQTLSLAQYVALYAPEGERDAKQIECEVIEDGR